MYDPSREPYPNSGPLRFKDKTDLLVERKFITRPPFSGFNGECLHFERVKRLHLRDIYGFDFSKQVTRFIDVEDGLIQNVHGDANFNNEENFCMAMHVIKGCRGLHFEDLLIENVAPWKNDTGWLNGDCWVSEPGNEALTGMFWTMRNAPDAILDIKSDLTLSGADLRNAGHQIIKIWQGVTLTLVDAFLDDSNVGITCIGVRGHQIGHPTLGTPGRVEYYDVRFGGGINFPFHLLTHDSTGAPKPTADECLLELSSNPYPNGIPHWTPSGVVIPPPQPPEPPMSSLDPAYLFSHMQGVETTFPVPTDLAFGVREGDPGFNDIYFFEPAFQGTISPPPNQWDAIFGDPAPGFLKAVGAKAVGASNGLTEADVNALIDAKLAAVPRTTVLGG